MIPDKELFLKEVAEQKGLMQFKEKFKRLEKKDLVKGRVDEGKIVKAQMEYMAGYTGMSSELEKVGVDEKSEVYKEVRSLIERNERRRKELEKQGRPLLEREYNRIL